MIAGNSGDSFDIWGDAVNIAARMESSGETRKIHITEKTADYLEGQGKLTPRGEIDLLPGRFILRVLIQIFWNTGADF